MTIIDPVIPDAELVVNYMVVGDLDPDDSIGDLLATIRIVHKEARRSDVHESQDLQNTEGAQETLRAD